MDALGIQFLTLQCRIQRLPRALRARPARDWRTVQLRNVGSHFRMTRLLDDQVRLRCHACRSRASGFDPELRTTLSRMSAAQRLPH